MNKARQSIRNDNYFFIRHYEVLQKTEVIYRKEILLFWIATLTLCAFGKEKWEKKLADFYQKFHSKNYEHARRTLILGLSKFIAESSPSATSPQKRWD